MKTYVILVIGLSTIAYDIYHLLNGTRNIFAYQKLNTDLAEKKKFIERLRSDVFILKEKVIRMTDAHLNIDLLQEQVTKIIDFADKKAYIIELE